MYQLHDQIIIIYARKQVLESSVKSLEGKEDLRPNGEFEDNRYA